MSEQINITRLLKDARFDGDSDEDRLQWALMSLLGQHDMERWVDRNGDGDGDIVIDVDMQINGKDVTFSEILSRIFKYLEVEVLKRAQELADELVYDQVEKLTDATNEFMRKLKIRVPGKKENVKILVGFANGTWVRDTVDIEIKTGDDEWEVEYAALEAYVRKSDRPRGDVDFVKISCRPE